MTLDGYFIIMIREKNAKLYCKDDISLIENYEIAVNDQTQIWHCHHRGEILPCGRFTPDDLEKNGLYWKRPACELIFMTISDHLRLHRIGKHHSKETKKKLSEANIGENHPNYGKHLSEETKRNISESLSKHILQYSKEGEFIREWIGATEAGRVLGINQGNITTCCKGKLKSAGGFVWSYKYI